ncbi:MAG: M23 family metallopeptidase [Microthrixaceae bacterium]
MPASTRRHLLVLLTAVGVVVVAPRVGAQEGPVQPTAPTSSTSSTSSSVPAPTDVESTTSVPADDSPTTTIYVPVLPPELTADPRTPFLVDPGPEDGVDIPIAQRSFDPLSIAVRPELVTAATAAVDAASAALTAAQDGAARAATDVARLTAELESIDVGRRSAVAEAATARKNLLERAVTAYMVGDVDERLALVNSSDAVDLGVARNYIGVVADGNQRLVRRYEQLSKKLDSSHLELADSLGEASADLGAKSEAVRATFGELLSAVQELQAYQAGAHAYISGFVFPVAGDTEFIDSWGYPRMTGTASAHWHQGADLFADHGTPLIAAENGVVERVGVGSLGGNKLWVAGDSGNGYYYAHLSAFAPGIHDGQRVRAGELVGFVGDTGNARGTSPHLHFEIHPGGIGPVNPYPLLRAAYGNRPKFTAVVPTTVPPAPSIPEPAAAGG